VIQDTFITTMPVREAKWETGIPTRAFELIEVESCSAATWRRSDKSVSMLVTQTTHTHAYVRCLATQSVSRQPRWCPCNQEKNDMHCAERLREVN